MFWNMDLRNWVFYAKIKDKTGKIKNLDLFYAMGVKIKRHIKVRAEATPYDPQYREYFEQLKRSRKLDLLEMKETLPIF